MVGGAGGKVRPDAPVVCWWLVVVVELRPLEAGGGVAAGSRVEPRQCLALFYKIIAQHATDITRAGLIRNYSAQIGN